MKVACYFLALLLPVLTASAQTPALEVESSTGATLFQVNTDGSLIVNPQGATNGHVLTTDASGNATWQASTGGFMLPFDETWGQLFPAFSITKTAGGDLMDLRNTAGGRLLFGVMSNGSPGSWALEVSSSHGGFQMQSGDGVGVDVSNSSANPTLRAVNNGAGLAGSFQGDVSVTGGALSLSPSGLSCTGCVGSAEVQDGALSGVDVLDESLTGNDIANGSLTPADVNASSGFYVSKGQLYTETVAFTVSDGGSDGGEAFCRDTNDLPLMGSCFAPPSVDVSLRATRTIDWESLTDPAGYECTYTNRSSSTVTFQARITCLAVD